MDNIGKITLRQLGLVNPSPISPQFPLYTYPCVIVTHPLHERHLFPLFHLSHWMFLSNPLCQLGCGLRHCSYLLADYSIVITLCLALTHYPHGCYLSLVLRHVFTTMPCLPFPSVYLKLYYFRIPIFILSCLST